MPTLLIIYHSMTGGTERMVHACANAARGEPALTVEIKPAAHTTSADVLGASGYIFATPEYLGGMSGMMKDFFDRTYYEVIDQVHGRPYASMVCAGSDGQGAVGQVERIVTGWRLKAICPAVIVNVAAQTPERIKAVKDLDEQQLTPCAELGALMGTGLALSVF